MYKVNVSIPQKFKEYLNNPEPYIKDTMTKAKKESLEFLRERIIDKDPPVTRTGYLDNSFKIDADKGKLFTQHPGAKALDMGAFIRAKKAKVLHFEVNGKDVFTKFVRLKATKFVTKTADENVRHIVDIFTKNFEELHNKIT
ncbi:MAG: hypothetical protein ACYCXQ_00990 [Candidatus Humimicrobiaceae bacterium]